MNLKELFQNKLFKMLAIVIGVLLVLIVIIVVFASLQGGRLSSFSALESKMVAAAKSYYENNTDKLPGQVGGKAEVDSATLAQENYLKDLDEISPKGSTCSGRVIVKNVNQKYFYQAFVSCGDKYQTTTLTDYIKSHENTVTVGAGLYTLNGNSIYRGENPNNYIKFANRVYRIVRIYSDGTMDIIATEYTTRTTWDDRYNQDRNRNDGINDYTVSRVRDTLLAYVNSTSFTDIDRSMLEPHSLCLGKVSENTAVTLDMECSKTLDGQVIGLLPASSYMYASLDATCRTISDGTCQNYNYLQVDYSWWTLTANNSDTYRAHSIQSQSSIYTTRCSTKSFPREVLRITENAVYVSGNGTSQDPYVIK